MSSVVADVAVAVMGVGHYFVSDVLLVREEFLEADDGGQ